MSSCYITSVERLSIRTGYFIYRSVFDKIELFEARLGIWLLAIGIVEARLLGEIPLFHLPGQHTENQIHHEESPEDDHRDEIYPLPRTSHRVLDLEV